jgi:biopolymer transport protein ExbD
VRIYLRAYQNVRYGDLISVRDLLRAGGYLKAALVGRQVLQ